MKIDPVPVYEQFAAIRRVKASDELPNVEFPAPLSPTRAWFEPRSTTTEISFSACTPPKCFDISASLQQGCGWCGRHVTSSPDSYRLSVKLSRVWPEAPAPGPHGSAWALAHPLRDELRARQRLLGQQRAPMRVVERVEALGLQVRVPDVREDDFRT